MCNNNSRSVLYDRKEDKFFEKENCDRCHKSLRDEHNKSLTKIFTMSWFTDETICTTCEEIEIKIKKAMRKQGMNPDHYEGCGYVPDVKISEED